MLGHFEQGEFMKWRVEYIASQANIIVDDPSIPPMEQEPVGMGFPTQLAERIVRIHNEAIDALTRKPESES
jgi:hypothetical protein